MRIRPLAVLCGATALLVSTAYRAQSPAASPDRAAQYQLGKRVFTSHCAECHNANAAKKLPDGSTLLSRLAADKDPNARLATRTKNLSAEDARGIDVYMEILVAAYKASQKPPSDH